MSFFKSFFCKHDYKIAVVDKLERKGTMIVHLTCKKCGKPFDTFHDFTETEDPSFRNPMIEKMLNNDTYFVNDQRKPK